ncbi:hypothetical protein LOZ80_33775 [Paenibacillus sp. HWE-109]|uniref:hypothetical protein n=1 Tax=Paenibacillus sp. HWE-109 TaxID=1306526 RepID=UPI001EDD7FA3|nr:hypothetical protein [Paenibacillus sp. HWE-109]UKS26434.1 hypothetical protein LOZ80_33775 [Paenibacillus sp. HWE-109]
MLILASVVTLSACASSISNTNSASPQATFSPATATATVTPSSATTPSPAPAILSSAPSQLEARAIGTLTNGEILIAPKTMEIVEQLGAPSCLGKSEDYSIKSDYEAIFKDSTGKKTTIVLPEIDTFITSENKQLTLPTLHFKDFQAVVLAPRYTDCHGIEFYLIGTKGSAAFSFKFKTDEGTFDSFNYAPNTQLQVMDDQLVIEPGQSAGSEAKKQRIFKPDWQNQTMQLVKS